MKKTLSLLTICAILMAGGCNGAETAETTTAETTATEETTTTAEETTTINETTTTEPCIYFTPDGKEITDPYTVDKYGRYCYDGFSYVWAVGYENYNSVDNPEMFGENLSFNDKEKLEYFERCYCGIGEKYYKRINTGETLGGMTVAKAEYRQGDGLNGGYPSSTEIILEGEITLEGYIVSDPENPIYGASLMFYPTAQSLNQKGFGSLMVDMGTSVERDEKQVFRFVGTTAEMELGFDTGLEYLLNDEGYAKVRLTFSGLRQFWVYDNGSGWAPWEVERAIVA